MGRTRRKTIVNPQVQEEKKERKRRTIIRASLRVFARKGYETTALDEVARAARLAKGTLYLYFKDKQDLYSQVMLNVLERLETYVSGQIEETQDPFEQMEAIARAQIAFFASNRGYFRLLTVIFAPEMAGRRRELSDPLFSKRQKLGRYLHALVEEGKAKGLIRSDIDTRDMVLSFMGMVNEAVRSVCLARISSSAADRSRSSAAERAGAIMKILTQGIAVQPEGGICS